MYANKWGDCSALFCAAGEFCLSRVAGGFLVKAACLGYASSYNFFPFFILRKCYRMRLVKRLLLAAGGDGFALREVEGVFSVCCIGAACPEQLQNALAEGSFAAGRKFFLWFLCENCRFPNLPAFGCAVLNIC